MTDLYVTDEAGIPITSDAQKECELTKLVSNYAKLCEIDYLTAFQEFNEEIENAYGVDIYKLNGNGTECQKIVDNGLYEQAKDVLNELISQCSKANIGYTAEEATQLTNAIIDLSYKNNIYKDFINSVPNCTIIDGIPYQCKRVVKRLTNDQMDAINEYASKHGIDPVEAMHVLFD